MSQPLQAILKTSTARHTHLCPRQVLGARIGLAGANALGLDVPQTNKRLLVILETDGCFADGVEAATGCTVGHRTLRVADYGKVAATFVDTKTKQAYRLNPHHDVRQKAHHYAPGESRRYFAQLAGYQIMPDAELLSITPVYINQPIKSIISRAGVRVNCDSCGEEIINEREVRANDKILCRTCFYGGYYSIQQPFESPNLLYKHAEDAQFTPAVHTK